MPLMRRRPLLRAAAVGGGAYVAGPRAAQASQREAGQQQQVSDPQGATGAPAARGGGLSSDAMAQLKELADLHEQGILTDDEFAQHKQRLLGGS